MFRRIVKTEPRNIFATNVTYRTSQAPGSPRGALYNETPQHSDNILRRCYFSFIG